MSPQIIITSNYHHPGLCRICDQVVGIRPSITEPEMCIDCYDEQVEYLQSIIDSEDATESDYSTEEEDPSSSTPFQNCREFFSG
jgi:hypothetical protein